MEATTLPMTIPDLSPIIEKLKDDPMVKQLKEKVDHYKRIGIAKGLKTLEERLQLCLEAKALRELGMGLFFAKWIAPFPEYWGRRDLAFVQEDGSYPRDSYSMGRFAKTKLKNFKGNIPAEVLEKIPDGSADQAYVFKKLRSVDPILAIRVKGNKFIALYKWD